jgi:hypothetical protein
MFKNLLILICLMFIYLKVKSQDNYEIQVYGSETIEAGHTMLELHSNYTAIGFKTAPNGQFPDNNVFHETIEITHGFTSWFETGFYLFTSIGSGGRTAYIGSHIRPRVSVPEKWHWPIGVSLSVEYGLQKAAFSPNTSTLEIRPIADKKLGKFYLAFNPALSKSFRGPDANRGFIFSPNIKISYDISKELAVGPEYYGSTGPFFHYDNFHDQQHQLFAAFDLNTSKIWEFNGGMGYGLTPNTERLIFKIIIGRKF